MFLLSIEFGLFVGPINIDVCLLQLVLESLDLVLALVHFASALHQFILELSYFLVMLLPKRITSSLFVYLSDTWLQL